MAGIFVSSDLIDIPEISLKLQKDLCHILLFKRQIKIYYDETGDESISVSYTSHHLNVHITLKKLHPFVTPHVLVDNLNYNDWMIKHSECAYSLLHRLKFSPPCCNSLLNNWTPLIHINSLLNEIENNIELVHILNGIYDIIEHCMYESKYNKDYTWIADMLLQYLV